MDAVKELEQRLAEHAEYCDERFEKGNQKMDLLIQCQTDNTQSINRLVDEVSELTTDTKGMLTIYRDVQGAARVGSAVKKAAMWLAGIPFIGAGFHYAYTWLIENFNSGI